MQKVRILDTLRSSGRPMTATEIAQRLASDSAGTHRHVQSLAASRLIAKSTSHRKWVYYRLTPRGEEALGYAMAALRRNPERGDDEEEI